MPEVVVFGKASKKVTKLKVNKQDLDKSLMDFLRENGLPIASSCLGEGVCQKCVFNNDKLSCQEKVSDWQGDKKVINIDYL